MVAINADFVQILSLFISESIPDLLAAVKILAGSTVEIAAASVGDGSLVKAVQKIEEDSKACDSFLELTGTEIQEALEEVMVKEAAAAVNKEELRSAEGNAGEEEQDEIATSAPTVKPNTDAEDQVTGGDSEMESSDIPSVDPADEATSHEEAATDKETVVAEKATQAEEPPPTEEAIRAQEAVLDEVTANEEITTVDEAALAEEATVVEEAALAAKAIKAEEATVEEEATVAEEDALDENAALVEEITQVEGATVPEKVAKAEEATVVEETMSNEEAGPAEETILNEEATSVKETTVAAAERSVDEKAAENSADSSEAAVPEESDLNVLPAADPESTTGAPEMFLCHSAEEIAAPGEPLVSEVAVVGNEREAPHSKETQAIKYIPTFSNGPFWL